MRVRIYTILAAIAALTLLPSSALAAPAKAKVRFTSSSFVVSENAGTAQLTVTRSARNGKAHSATNTSASVAYATTNGTALAGTDYTASKGRLTFPACPGNPKATDPCLVQRISVPITDDAVVDGNKSLKVSLNAPSRNAVVVNPQKAMLTIADNEGPNTISFDAPDYKAWELGPQVELHVIRSGAGISGSSSVDLATADGSATAPSDYSSVATTLNFAPNEVDKTVLIDITDDSVVESSETFDVNLSNATSGAQVTTPSAPVTILDDDTPAAAHVALDASAYSVSEGSDGTVTVNRTGAVDTPVTIDYATVAQTATPNVDFAALADTLSFDPGDTSQSFSVTTYGDSIQEGDETFGLNLSNAVPSSTVVDTGSATLTIGDDDPQPTVAAGDSSATATSVTFDVQLSNPTTHDVTVTYVITDANGNQVATGTATVPAGSSSTTVTAPVTGTGPFTVTVSNPSGATLDGTGTSSTTNSTPPPVVTVGPSAGSGSGSTSGSSASFDVTIPAPTDHPVTVDYTVTDGSGTTVGSGTVTIPTGGTSVTVSVPVPGGTEGSVTVVLTDATGGTIGSGGGSTSVPVTDSSTQGSSTGSGGSGSTSGSTGSTSSTGSTTGSTAATSSATDTGSAQESGTSDGAGDASALAASVPAGTTGPTPSAAIGSTSTTTSAAAPKPGLLDQQIVLDAGPTGACKLSVRAAKALNRRTGVLTLWLTAGRACTVIAGASAKHARGKQAISTRLVRALKTRRQTLSLAPRKTARMRLRFSARGLRFVKRAIQAKRPLTLTVSVIQRDTAKRVTKRVYRTRLLLG